MYEKYKKANDDCFEHVAPTTFGASTTTFTNKHDALWLAVEVGATDRGSFQYGFPAYLDCTIDGVDIQLRNTQVLELEAKEITVTVNGASKVWFRILGLERG